LSFGNCDGVFAAIAVLAHSDANVAKDIVAGVSVEGDSVSVDGDPSAWSSLPRDGDVFMDDDAFCDVDHAADFKHNDAIELTNSISERAWTGIVEVMRPTPSAQGKARGGSPCCCPQASPLSKVPPEPGAAPPAPESGLPPEAGATGVEVSPGL
jgi:hypothetical protein